MIGSIVADMHTHSEYSHDSVCKIEDMLLSQLKKGTEIMAVTDHFDTASFRDYDVFSPIKEAHTTVKKMNDKYSEFLILSGIEIGEGFWYPEIYKKVMELADYDVVIGSVHLVKYKSLTMAYSKIDFSELSETEIVEYMDAYFDDMMTMLEEMDFDILAHITSPLRYIKGKYRIDVDMSQYEEKIDKILCNIIQRGIALEVNTSSVGCLNDFMPTKEILVKYYDMGGRLITLGSDAHNVERASYKFKEAVEMLKEIGFSSICYYKNRKPYQIEI